MQRPLSRLTAVAITSLALASLAGAAPPFDPATVGYVLEDAGGDVGDPCIPDADGCDIVLFEAGNTATEFYHRTTVASLAGQAPTGEIAFRVTFNDAAGNAQFTNIGVTSGGSRSFVFNSDTGEPLADHEFAVDREAGTVTVWAPLGSVAGAPGAAIEFTGIETSYNPTGGPGAGGAYLTGMDSVDITGTFTLGAGGDAPSNETMYANATGDDVRVTHLFANATSNLYITNWTAPEGSFNITLDVGITNGSVSVAVTDAAGNEQMNGTFTANTTDETVASDVPAGNWTLSVAYTNFTGALDLLVEKQPPPPANTTTTTTTTTTTNPFPPQDADEGLPGPAFAVVVVALGAALWTRRQLR